MLDGSLKSSIEWQASLLISQLLNVSLNANRTKARSVGSETKRESRLLDKVLKADHNSASVLITDSARRSKQRLVVVL
jgi:hypothetical protein